MDEAVLPVVYADETHNTGENLLDDDQPVYVVGGLHLSDDLAGDIVEQVRGARQRGAGEPKFQVLARRSSGRRLLLSALSRVPEGAAKVVIADKRYMTVSKIVDLTTEEVMFEAGHNMLADGSAKTLANVVHLFGHQAGDKDKFDAALMSFVDLLRTGTVGVDRYVSAAEAYLATVVPGSRETFEFALLPSKSRLVELFEERARGEHPDTLDPAIPTVAMLLDAFHADLGPFGLVHDHSEVIERNRELLLTMDQLPDPADPSKKLASSAHSIDLADSKTIPQLQIVDWIAGAARELGMSYLNPPRKTVEDEWKTMVHSWSVGNIWPDQEWLTEHLGIPFNQP